MKMRSQNGNKAPARTSLMATGRRDAQTPTHTGKRKRQQPQQTDENTHPAPQRTQQQQQQQQRSKRKKRTRRNVEVLDEPQQQQQQDPKRPDSSSTTTAMEQLESEDYFEVLGLARSATDGDVKKAYRRLAVLWHPDKNRTHPKAEEYFKKIGEAYAVLSNAEQRTVYERYGKAGLGGGNGSASSSGEGFYPADPYGFSFGGFDGHAGFSARHARDIFDAFFGGMNPFEELFNGGRGGGGRRQSRANRNANEWDPMGGMGMGFGMDMRGGSLGSMMMDSFFSGGGMSMGMGGGMGIGMGGFADFGSFGGGGGFSSSMSSSSFTDRNGHVVTKKTTTTVDANGRAETVTEEFRNGKLVNSTLSSTSRLADAGRMQLEGNGAKDASVATAPRRMSSSSSRTRF